MITIKGYSVNLWKWPVGSHTIPKILEQIRDEPEVCLTRCDRKEEMKLNRTNISKVQNQEKLSDEKRNDINLLENNCTKSDDVEIEMYKLFSTCKRKKRSKSKARETLLETYSRLFNSRSPVEMKSTEGDQKLLFLPVLIDNSGKARINGRPKKRKRDSCKSTPPFVPCKISSVTNAETCDSESFVPEISSEIVVTSEDSYSEKLHVIDNIQVSSEEEVIDLTSEEYSSYENATFSKVVIKSEEPTNTRAKSSGESNTSLNLSMPSLSPLNSTELPAISPGENIEKGDTTTKDKPQHQETISPRSEVETALGHLCSLRSHQERTSTDQNGSLKDELQHQETTSLCSGVKSGFVKVTVIPERLSSSRSRQERTSRNQNGSSKIPQTHNVDTVNIVDSVSKQFFVGEDQRSMSSVDIEKRVSHLHSQTFQSKSQISSNLPSRCERESSISLALETSDKDQNTLACNQINISSSSSQSSTSQSSRPLIYVRSLATLCPQEKSQSHQQQQLALQYPNHLAALAKQTHQILNQMHSNNSNSSAVPSKQLAQPPERFHKSSTPTCSQYNGLAQYDQPVLTTPMMQIQQSLNQRILASYCNTLQPGKNVHSVQRQQMQHNSSVQPDIQPQIRSNQNSTVSSLLSSTGYLHQQNGESTNIIYRTSTTQQDLESYQCRDLKGLGMRLADYLVYYFKWRFNVVKYVDGEKELLTSDEFSTDLIHFKEYYTKRVTFYGELMAKFLLKAQIVNFQVNVMLEIVKETLLEYKINIQIYKIAVHLHELANACSQKYVTPFTIKFKNALDIVMRELMNRSTKGRNPPISPFTPEQLILLKTQIIKFNQINNQIRAEFNKQSTNVRQTNAQNNPPTEQQNYHSINRFEREINQNDQPSVIYPTKIEETIEGSTKKQSKGNEARKDNIEELPSNQPEENQRNKQIVEETSSNQPEVNQDTQQQEELDNKQLIQSAITHISNSDNDCDKNGTDDVIDLTWIDDCDPDEIYEVLHECKFLPVKYEVEEKCETKREVSSPTDSGFDSPRVQSNEVLQCLCGKNAVYLCTLCNSSVYCSKECQTQDWDDHKSLCERIKT